MPLVQAGIVRFVFPVAPDDYVTRWGDAITKVKSYAKEMKIELVEYEL
jgi:hypothetical protein